MADMVPRADIPKLGCALGWPQHIWPQYIWPQYMTTRGPVPCQIGGFVMVGLYHELGDAPRAHASSGWNGQSRSDPNWNVFGEDGPPR